MPEATQDRQFADNYRRIKRPIIEAAFAPPAEGAANPRLVMLASALPGDGKTFTSINLAMSIARERDISVVLVDADMPKPHVSSILGAQDQPGLLDALVDESVDVESLVMRTNIRGLAVLPAGRPTEGATELLASERMRQVIARLLAGDPRRIVLFDSPPLLVSSESSALAKIAGQIILVVTSGKTPRQALLNAIAVIDDQKSVSLVLNQGHAGMMDSYYGYGAYGNNGGDVGK
jgi:exopolysaccharide/PEP-CTERM locus tyrosine autokinase